MPSNVPRRRPQTIDAPRPGAQRRPVTRTYAFHGEYRVGGIAGALLALLVLGALIGFLVLGVLTLTLVLWIGCAAAVIGVLGALLRRVWGRPPRS